MYPGRGVLHTPYERFRRKRGDAPIHKYTSSAPPSAFMGRMLLRPYTIGKSEIKKRERIRYPCRGVLHTPHKYSIKDHYTLHKYASSPPPAAFVGRMQYAPTVIQELNPKKRKRKIRIHDSTCTRICFWVYGVRSICSIFRKMDLGAAATGATATFGT